MDGPEPITAAELESVRVDVRIAIEAHVEDRSDEGYDRLKEVFAPEKGRRVDDTEASSTTTLKLHLIALRSCVNLLGKNCSGLIRALLNCDWVGRDEGFVKEYVQFLGHLASAQGAYVGIVVNTLVGNFRSSEILFLASIVYRTLILVGSPISFGSCA
jgi:RNA polymerase I-specific transcription initiation factor RRN3